MTLLKDNNYKEINVALLSLEADIKNKITNFDTSAIDKQLVEINSRIDKINAGDNNTSAEINDIRYEIEDINSKLDEHSDKIEDIEQKLSDIFSAENKVTDFNTTTNSGIYYWVTDAANKPTDYGVLLVNKYDGGSNSIWINQIAYGTNNKIYFRQNINSGKWTDWKAVAFEGEIKALTVNGKTYDGSEAVDAGVQKIENGGTGVTTQADINKAFIGNLIVGNDNVTDGTEFVSSCASNNGFADSNALNKPYKRQFIKVWNYIKDKISSVLGLTSEKVSSYDSHLTNKDNPHSVTKSQVGLGSVVNTGDSATPVSGGTTKFTTGGAYTELNKKVDKVDGKGLSSNDFTDTYKGKLDNIDTTVTTDSSNLVTSGAVSTAISTEVTNRNTAITNAINNLDVSSVGGDGKYISAISETDGKISATSTTMDTAPTTNSVKAVTSGGIKTAISTAETNAKNLANATGTLAIAHGGTGQTTENAAANAFINSLEIGTAIPVDDTYYISQDTAETSSYDRRPVSKLWEYIKGKISSVLGLTKDNYSGKAATAGTADKATNDSNGNSIVNTYALKSDLQYTKSINIMKSNGSSNTWYYLIAKMLNSDSAGNIDSLFVNGSDYKNRMFEGSIRTRAGNYIYNYGKNNLPIELYMQTDGIIYVYWLVSDAYNKVALNITATMPITTYGGNLSAVTPTGSKMTLTEYDYKSYETLPISRGGTGANTAEAAANSLITSLPASDNVPVDSDYFISQVVNGGPFVPGYERRPISKLWEYIKDKILQEGEDFGYNHIVYDDASLLEWANCTDGSMTKVLVKNGTYNMTKGVDFSKAGTGYVFAENGAVINSKVPIAFSAPSGKTAVHNLKVVCGPSSDNTCAFSANDVLNLILYDCEAGYATNTITVNRNLFSKCTCYNCHYNFTYSSSNSSMSIKVFYQCYCYNCICKQTIAANSSSAVSFATDSFFYKECVCVSCDAELTILRNIKAATPSFSCYYNCWDRCVGCLSKINVNSSALTVYSTLYGFMRCQHMSSCKEVHTVGYTNIKGVVQCIYISSTSAVSGESNTNVGNSCDI